MLNQKPIFIVGFARGGSNILLNLLRSHPELCSPRGETHQVFKGKPDESFAIRFKKKIQYLPIVLREKRDIFSTELWKQRAPFKNFTKKKIDRILFDEKVKARQPGQNLYKQPNELYTDEEIMRARLLTKNLNGLIFLSQEFKNMYPSATFFGLVRNGYAVCEGILRRGNNPDQLQQIAENYNSGCQQMIKDAQQIPNFFIHRYEDLIANPLDSLKKICEQGELDLSMLTKIRLETKNVISSDGKFVTNYKNKQLVWYNLDNFHDHFRIDANENQIKRLDDIQKEIIRHTCSSVLNYFDY